MNDLISRQAAIEEMQEYWRTLNLRRKRIPLAAEAVYMDLKGVISTLPSAQPEIIRCKDCKHRDAENGFCEGRGFPMQLVPDDGFCDKGERSEE